MARVYKQMVPYLLEVEVKGAPKTLPEAFLSRRYFTDPYLSLGY